jgi:GTPase SAR1 family protein
MRDRQGFILVYDITNPSSVDDLSDLYTQILRNKLTTSDTHNSDDPLIPLVLVGNKLDLAMERKVSHQRGKELSRHWKCPHYETSAKTRTNVDEIFYDLVGQIIAIREEAVRSRKASGTGSSLGAAGEKDDDDDTVGAGCCVVS